MTCFAPNEMRAGRHNAKKEKKPATLGSLGKRTLRKHDWIAPDDRLTNVSPRSRTSRVMKAHRETLGLLSKSTCLIFVEPLGAGSLYNFIKTQKQSLYTHRHSIRVFPSYLLAFGLPLLERMLFLVLELHCPRLRVGIATRRSSLGLVDRTLSSRSSRQLR